MFNLRIDFYVSTLCKYKMTQERKIKSFVIRILSCVQHLKKKSSKGNNISRSLDSFACGRAQRISHYVYFRSHENKPPKIISRSSSFKLKRDMKFSVLTFDRRRSTYFSVSKNLDCIFYRVPLFPDFHLKRHVRVNCPCRVV